MRSLCRMRRALQLDLMRLSMNAYAVFSAALRIPMLVDVCCADVGKVLSSIQSYADDCWKQGTVISVLVL